MTKKRLLELIDEGENLKIEFKQRFSTHEKIAKEMIALANTRGGYLIFGIDDDGSIYGVESEKGEAELVKETAEKYCEPPVKIEMSYFELEAKEIVLVEIKESINKPHRLQDYSDKLDPSAASVYIRINDKSVLASKEMIKILQAQSSGLSLKNYFVGKIEKSVFEYLDKNETITVMELSENTNISKRRASRTLIKLVRANLLHIHTKDNGENYFTYAGR